MKRIVVPGELITDKRKKTGSHVFVREGKIYSDIIGLANEDGEFASVVPLEGKYVPMRNDLIVGVVSGEKFSGYDVNINTLYTTYLSKKEIRERLKIGSIISAKVMEIDEMREVNIGNIRVFYDGEIITVSPVKVPRIIGREGSMLNVLKAGTGSSVIVGRNGWIWAKGGNIPLLIESIKKIEDEAHMDNLTNRMEEFLSKKAGKKAIEPKAKDEKAKKMGEEMQDEMQDEMGEENDETIEDETGDLIG
ncbi:MAG: KH domain-containing protein [Candidatus Diapherotrites archaeon]